MKIAEMRIEGYRSLRNVTWRPGDLNVLIGPNGGGKSNLLQTLIMLRASAEGKLGYFVLEQGGPEAIFWDGSPDTINLKVVWPSFDADHKARHYEYHVKLERVGRSTDMQVAVELLGEFGSEPSDANSLVVKYLDRVGASGDVGNRKLTNILNNSETLLSMIDSPLIDEAEVKDIKRTFAAYGIFTDFVTAKNCEIRLPCLTRLTQRLDNDGANLIAVLHTLYTTNPAYKLQIDDAMQAAFGPEFQELTFPPASDQRIQLRIRWKSLRRTSATPDLSDGTLRFLFIIAALADPSPPPLIAIDEPETGLHPQMLRVIAELAAEASTRTQVVLTTHSPQLLDALSDFNPTVTVVEVENGETKLRNVNGDDLSYWLRDYSLGSLFRSGELENLAHEQDEAA